MKRCFYCHSKENLTKDHIVPKSRGGKRSKKDNLQHLCRYCNRMKGNLLESEIEGLMYWLKYIEENRETPLKWKEEKKEEYKSRFSLYASMFE